MHTTESKTQLTGHTRCGSPSRPWKDVILQFPDLTKDWYISVDSSNFAFGGVLEQAVPTGKLRPVHFFSKNLQGTVTVKNGPVLAMGVDGQRAVTFVTRRRCACCQVLQSPPLLFSMVPKFQTCTSVL